MGINIKPWKMHDGKVTMYRLADKLDLEVIDENKKNYEQIAQDFFETFKLKPVESKPAKPKAKPRARPRAPRSKTDELAKVYQIPIYAEYVNAIKKEVGSEEFSVDEVKIALKKLLNDPNSETLKNKAGAYLVYLRDNDITVVTRHEGLKKFYKFEESKNSASSAE